MPRQPKLRKKSVGKERYWYTEAGGPTYFGNVDDVSYTQAKKLFADHTQSLLDEKKDAKLHGFTAGDLLDLSEVPPLSFGAATIPDEAVASSPV